MLHDGVTHECVAKWWWCARVGNTLVANSEDFSEAVGGEFTLLLLVLS